MNDTISAKLVPTPNADGDDSPTSCRVVVGVVEGGVSCGAVTSTGSVVDVASVDAGAVAAVSDTGLAAAAGTGAGAGAGAGDGDGDGDGDGVRLGATTAGAGAGVGSRNGVSASGTNNFPLSPISRTTLSNRCSNAALSSCSASHIAYLFAAPCCSAKAGLSENTEGVSMCATTRGRLSYHILVPMIKPTAGRATAGQRHMAMAVKHTHTHSHTHTHTHTHTRGTTDYRPHDSRQPCGL